MTGCRSVDVPVNPTNPQESDEMRDQEEIDQARHAMELNQLLASHNLRRVPTPGGGNCFLHCLSYFLHQGDFK